MITKGTAEYKQAQELANSIQKYAEVDRWNNNSFFEIAFNKLGAFIGKIQDLEVFAAQIANTVDNSMNPYGRKVANVSSKQAWILAVAAVENNINF